MTCVLLCASLWVAIQTSYRERFRLSRISEFLCPDTGGTSARPTVRAGRRTLCVGQECRKTSQRDCYAPQASGPLIQKGAGRRSLPSRDQLLMRLGAAKSAAGRAFQFVHLQVPGEDQEVTRETFQFWVDKKKLQAAEWRDGHYLLRSNLTAGDPSVLWARYVQLTQIESVFRSLKSELGIRPIYHQLEHRADAHILIAFLAYCLQITLKQRLLLHAPGLTPTAVLEKLAEIQMIDIWIPTVDQRWLILPRYTQPSSDTKLLIEKLKLELPSQPPPRLTAQEESNEIEVPTIR